MSRRLFTATFTAMFIWVSCTKDNEADIVASLKISVSEKSTEATLSWSPPVGNSGTVNSYNVYCCDSLVAENLQEPHFRLTGLIESTSYYGKVEAFCNGKKTSYGTYSFTTSFNNPPNAFKLVTTDITNNSVRLVWEKATDPENDTLTYAIFLNNKLQTVIPDTNFCEISGLAPLTNYNCRIVATDSYGKTRDLPVSFKTIELSGSHMIRTVIAVDNYKRDFSIYLPHTIQHQHDRPLVLFLHGANGNAWLQMQTSYFRTIADREDFLFVMPQALPGTLNGETVYQWDAHYLFPWDDVAFLNKLIDYMADNYRADLSRVYLSGMSNGGFMTFFAAREMQDRLTAIAPIAGLMTANIFNTYTLSHPLPLCYMHGTADSIVRMNSNPSLTNVLNLWININGCNPATIEEELPDLDNADNQTVTLFRYSGNLPYSEIRYYRINGGGHCIPGVEPGSTGDINAFEEIWSFFKRFRNENGK